jgi:hypothetical protein
MGVNDGFNEERERKILEGTGSFVAAVYGRWCDKSNFYSLIKSKPG